MTEIYKIAKIKMALDTKEAYFHEIMREYLLGGDEKDMYVKAEIADEIKIPTGCIIQRPKLSVFKENGYTTAYYSNNQGVYGAIRFDSVYSDCALYLLKDAVLDNLDYKEIGYLLLGMLFNYKLTYFNGVSLHGSAIKFDDDAIIFTAPSGVGKSTQAKLWKQKYGNRVTFINDDKPALRFEDGELYCYGTPFAGKEHLNGNTEAKVKAIINVVRGDVNKIEKTGKKESIALMLEETARSMLNGNANRNIFTAIEHILSCTPIYKLTCTKQLEAVETVYKRIYEEL